MWILAFRIGFFCQSSYNPFLFTSPAGIKRELAAVRKKVSLFYSLTDSIIEKFNSVLMLHLP